MPGVSVSWRAVRAPTAPAPTSRTAVVTASASTEVGALELPPAPARGRDPALAAEAHEATRDEGHEQDDQASPQRTHGPECTDRVPERPGPGRVDRRMTKSLNPNREATDVSRYDEFGQVWSPDHETRSGPVAVTRRERLPGVDRLMAYVPTPAALIIFWWLNREHLISSRPYWQLVALLVGCGLANVAALLWTRNVSDPVRIHVRAAVAAITTTFIIYATGWGPMIIVGFAIGIADVIHTDGARAWLPASLWAGAGVIAGQIAIETGVAPTLIPVAVGNAVALGNFILVIIVLRMFATAAEAANVAQDTLRRQANTDALTGLPNRSSITGSLERALVDEHAAVMFVDLDGFKEVNDRLGHERGDAVLVEAADRIAISLGPAGCVGRLGGDEFLVVLPDLSPHELVAMADRILMSLREPWPEGGAITASIGIASAGPRESADHLLDRADRAMYEAKNNGRSRWRTAV